MDFLLTALPRSGTTWASVWLADGALCLHDPLAYYTPQHLREYDPGCRWGISDTNIWALKNDVAAFCCPVAVIERPLEQIRTSMERLGAAPLSDAEVELYKRCEGRRFEYRQMFELDGAREIWAHLRPDMEMNVERWDCLRKIKMEPHFGRIHHDPKIMAQVMRQVRRAAEIAFG